MVCCRFLSNMVWPQATDRILTMLVQASISHLTAIGCFSTRSWRLSRRLGRISSLRTSPWSCRLGTTSSTGRLVTCKPTRIALTGTRCIHPQLGRLKLSTRTRYAVLGLATTFSKTILQETIYDHTIPNNFPTSNTALSSIRIAAIRQLYAQHFDWSVWAGEPIPIPLSALQEVRFEIAADLAPTQQNSLKFFCISRANGVPGNRLPVIPNRK
jgi:hypothetical protein